MSGLQYIICLISRINSPFANNDNIDTTDNSDNTDDEDDDINNDNYYY